MKAKRAQIEAMREKIRRGPDRSALFVWMVDHHAILLERDRSGRMPWIELCADFEALGLKDGRGKTPTPKRAGETWREACADVKARGRPDRLGQTAPANHRSKRSADWQPPAAQPLHGETARQPTRPRPNATTAPTAKTQEGSAHVEAQLAALDRQFAYIDRHIVQQPDEE